MSAAPGPGGRWSKALVTRLAEQGWTGLLAPAAFGGSARSNVDCLIILEELSREAFPLAQTLAVHNSFCVRHLAHFGTQDQKEKLLPFLASGGGLGGWAFVEERDPSGPGPHGIRTKKRRSSWVLNGSILGLGNPGLADVLIVVAATGPLLARRRRCSAFLLEQGAKGLGMSRVEGRHEPVPSWRIVLDEVTVPRASLLGTEGEGHEAAERVHRESQACLAALFLGVASAGLEAGLRHGKDHAPGGRSTSEALLWALADAMQELEMARLLAFRAAALLDRGTGQAQEFALAVQHAGALAARASAIAELSGRPPLIVGPEARESDRGWELAYHQWSKLDHLFASAEMNAV